MNYAGNIEIIRKHTIMIMKSRIERNKRLHYTPLVSLIVLLLVCSTLSCMQIKSLFASNVNAHSASNYRTLSPLRPDTTMITKKICVLLCFQSFVSAKHFLFTKVIFIQDAFKNIQGLLWKI